MFTTHFATTFPSSGEIRSVTLLTNLDTMPLSYTIETEVNIKINTELQYKFIKFDMRFSCN